MPRPLPPARLAVVCSAVLAAALAVSSSARADEGMWTYDNFPASAVLQKYGFRA